MKKLIIMCGCPASGKSTWIKEELKKSQSRVKVISRDFIRFSMLTPKDNYFDKEKKVFKRFCKDITESLEDKDIEIVIADATHLNKKSRFKLFANIKIPKDCVVEAVCLETSLNLCLKYNSQRTGLALVPEENLISMYHAYERPTLEEGFDSIRVFQNEYQEYKMVFTRRKRNDKF